VGGILPGFAGLVRWASSLPQKICGHLDFPGFGADGSPFVRPARSLQRRFTADICANEE